MTPRTMHIDQLKNSIERNEYAVDPGKVAEAIVALLLRDAGPGQASPG